MDWCSYFYMQGSALWQKRNIIMNRILYEGLLNTVYSEKQDSMTITMGDFNAKTGKERLGDLV